MTDKRFKAPAGKKKARAKPPAIKKAEKEAKAKKANAAKLAADTEAEIQANADLKGDIKAGANRGRATAAQTNKKRRRQRGPNDFSEQRKLMVDMSGLDTDKYAYRWVQDRPGRIRAFTKQNDYEIVPNEDGEISKGVGNDIRRAAGEQDMVLLRIPREYFEEDQRAKRGEINETEKQIEEGSLTAGKTGEGAVAHASSLQVKDTL